MANCQFNTAYDLTVYDVVYVKEGSVHKVVLKKKSDGSTECDRDLSTAVRMKVESKKLYFDNATTPPLPAVTFNLNFKIVGNCGGIDFDFDTTANEYVVIGIEDFQDGTVAYNEFNIKNNQIQLQVTSDELTVHGFAPSYFEYSTEICP